MLESPRVPRAPMTGTSCGALTLRARSRMGWLCLTMGCANGCSSPVVLEALELELAATSIQ
jgi:hypothetical protein